MPGKIAPEEGLRILSFHAENVKRIVVVDIRPDGAVIEVAGDNMQGKTSVLDSILWALKGKGAIQLQPVRAGEEAGFVKLDLGNDKGIRFRVTRRFDVTPDGIGYTTSLRLEDAEGNLPRGPQGILDAIAGDLAFDPLAFTRMKPQERIVALKAVVKDFDFAKADREYNALFDRRTEVNREAKRLHNAAEAIVIPPDAPLTGVNVSSLLEKLQDAEVVAHHRAEHDARATRLADTAQRYRDDVDRLKAELAQAEDNLDKAVGDLAEFEETPPPPDLIDTTAIRSQIEEAERINAQIAQRTLRQDYIDNAEAEDEEAARLTADLVTIKDRIRQAIENAKLPVKGLEIGDEDVILRGVPFSQASDAEQLRASIAIAMATNPTLRVIRVRDGSLLDSKAMELLKEVATADKFQFWVERVSPHGPSAVILEDGRVKRRNKQDAAAKGE